jgi:hypothetical protein
MHSGDPQLRRRTIEALHHTTVMHSIAKVEEHRRTDAALDQGPEQALKELGAALTGSRLRWVPNDSSLASHGVAYPKRSQ